MRIAVAVALAAAAQLTVASATRAPSVAVHSDLFYSTGDSCGSLNLPSSPHDVSGQLVKNDDFHGTVKLAPTALSPAGCSLHVVVDGSIDGDATADAFAVASQVDAALPQFLATTMLRGAKTQDLTLQRLQVTVNNTRNYAIDTNVATLTHDETGGTVTLTGQGCGTFSTKDLVNQLFTAGADSVGELAVVPDTMEDVECSVGVHVAGRAPTMSTSNEMVAFLKGIDDGLNKWFDASSTNQPGATLDATHATFTMAKPMTLHAVTASNVSHVNAPTKQITLGILMGITVLSAMLFGTIYQKKRHEHHLQSRHHNASQAAQIHRVSYRMGYQRVDGNAPEFGAEEEEKDGLL